MKGRGRSRKEIDLYLPDSYIYLQVCSKLGHVKNKVLCMKPFTLQYLTQCNTE